MSESVAAGENNYPFFAFFCVLELMFLCEKLELEVETFYSLILSHHNCTAGQM
jgi:hypothetical protein